MDSSPHLAARRAFLRQFFHDLATPLSAVSLHLEGADRRVARGADPSEPLSVARAELSRAFELFERGRELLLQPGGETAIFELDAWVEQTARAAGFDGVPIAGETGGRVRADRAGLSAALTALLTNAAEASSPDRVEIQREREGGRLRVIVRNPGSISEDPEKLFAPRAARAGRNWGMGLAMARLHAADTGGFLRLSEREGLIVAVLELPEEAVE